MTPTSVTSYFFFVFISLMVSPTFQPWRSQSFSVTIKPTRSMDAGSRARLAASRMGFQLYTEVMQMFFGFLLPALRSDADPAGTCAVAGNQAVGDVFHIALPLSVNGLFLRVCRQPPGRRIHVQTQNHGALRVCRLRRGQLPDRFGNIRGSVGKPGVAQIEVDLDKVDSGGTEIAALGG